MWGMGSPRVRELQIPLPRSANQARDLADRCRCIVETRAALRQRTGDRLGPPRSRRGTVTAAAVTVAWLLLYCRFQTVSNTARSLQGIGPCWFRTEA